MRRVDTAEVLVACAALTLGVGDAFLYRQDRRVVTDVLRTPPVLVGLLVLVAHVLDVLGPVDPFRFVAHRLTRRH